MKTIFNRAALLAIAVVCAWAAPAKAGSDNPECLGTQCGAPKQEGGGCGCGCGCSVWVAMTDDSKTLSYTDDSDGDGIPDGYDNCPFTPNRDQKDTDGDGVGDACDNCPLVANRDQRNSFNAKGPDGKPLGDACNPDIDGDGVPNGQDNCPYVPNPDQKNSFNARRADGSPMGDACNPDIDLDGVPNNVDNCPYWPNADQRLDNIPPNVVCRKDTDGDGVEDSSDNCPTVYNPDQKVSVPDPLGIDKRGDACNPDLDHDGVANEDDNCPTVPNPDQRNSTGATTGDACNNQLWVIYAGARNAKGVVETGDPLNLRGPFAISAGGKYTVPAGTSKLGLSLWANRNGAPIQYSFVVNKSPSGNASVQNATGYVTQSANNQYIFPAGSEPSIIGLEAGDYQLTVTANLETPDRAYPEIAQSVAALTVHVDDTPSKHGGCAAIPAAAPVVGLALALLALVQRRRHRK
jgi:hypothetical protein